MPEFADLPPSQIVPSLADRGIYIASESTMYRILRAENMQNHRGMAKAPKKTNHPTTYIASEPNQVWTWDITYLHSQIKGLYYKLYMILDIFSRKIVGWEVWKDESGELVMIIPILKLFLGHASIVQVIHMKGSIPSRPQGNGFLNLLIGITIRIITVD